MMQRSKLLLAALLLVPACANTPVTTAPEAAAPADSPQAADPTTAPLPLDPSVRMGKLDNGLTYYIRRHDQPQQRAHLWLAVDAGSVLEDEDQRGLAHFVEHMAFNGTKRFEKNTLIDFVERAGMNFGADLNAYTSFDETVYQLQVPTDDPKLLATGMDILEDWASAISFDPQEVDKERGVVIEEWRSGRGAQQRMFDKQWPIFLAGSKYAKRKPIGDKDILANAPVETLRRFYRDWYRPDLMAIVVVGDVDPDKIEREIKQRFADLKNPESARPRDNVPVPLLEETRTAVVTDDEAQMATVSLAFKGPAQPLRTESDYRAHLVENLFHGMLRARFDEKSRDPRAPFMFAVSFNHEMGRAADVFQLFAGVKTGMVEQTLSELVTEVERVRRHGFVASELERQKAEALRSYERMVAEKDKVDAENYASEIVDFHLEGTAMPGRDAELEIAKKYLPGITLAEVNALAETWTARKDRVVMANGPTRDAMPDEKALLAIVQSATQLDVAPYEDRDAAKTLMAQKPQPGAIETTETIPELGITVWTLSNGARVIIKPTDFKNDEILFEAFSPGGHSLAKDKIYLSASSADGVVAEGGLGEHDQTSLEKVLAGKVANVHPYVGELEEGLRGSASPQDLEALLQMIHLRFTAPRKDPQAFEAWKSQMIAFVKNRDLNPQRVFFEKLTAFTHNNHLRRRPLTTEALETIDLDTAYDFYKQRFADAGDFTFVFVGNVEPQRLEALAKDYLASLPTKGRKESWKDVGVRYPSGVKRFRVEKGQDPKSFVFLNFHGKTKWSVEAEDSLDMLGEALDIRLREVLREDMGGVYSPFTGGSMDRRPSPRYDYVVGFGCAPENVDSLKRAVLDVVASVKKEGIKEEYVEKLKEQRRRKLEIARKENRFWLRQLAKHYRYGTDPRQILELEESIERVTSKNIQEAAQQYLDERRYIEGVLMPEPGVAAATGTAPAKSAAAEAAAKPKKPTGDEKNG